MNVKTGFTWKNTIAKFESKSSKYFEPESLQDIIAIVKEAEAANVKVRAVGAGHSFSDVAITDNYIVDLDKIVHVQIPDNLQIRDKYKDKLLAEAGAGISIKDLNIKLDEMGLALINMGGIDHQKLGGVIATGTHGTGKDLQAFPGFVHSFTLVAGGGNAYRIEPTDGITDPAKFNSNGITLIQDDKTFYSLLVSFGTAGIIYSCIIEVWKTYYLRETKKLTNWQDLKQKFLDGSIFTEADPESDGQPPRGVSFMINPYEVDGDKHTCIVMRHFNLDKKPQKWILVEMTRNIISGILGNMPRMFFFSLWLFKVFPKRTPKLLRSALKGLKDDKFVHKSYKVLYQGFAFAKERAYDAEFAFNLDNIPAIINTIDELIAKADELARTKKYYQTSPLGMRFVQRGKAYLTPEYEREVAYIDTPFLLGFGDADDMLFEYQKVMLANGGIPHWGKTNTILDKHPEYLLTIYPKMNEWKEMIGKYNPKGSFYNKFNERLSLKGL